MPSHSRMDTRISQMAAYHPENRATYTDTLHRLSLPSAALKWPTALEPVGINRAHSTIATPTLSHHRLLPNLGNENALRMLMTAWQQVRLQARAKQCICLLNSMGPAQNAFQHASQQCLRQERRSISRSSLKRAGTIDLYLDQHPA